MSLTLDGLTGELTALTLTPCGAGEPVLTLGSAVLDGGTFDLRERRLSFAGVTLARGKVLAQFDPTGVPNWKELAKPSAPTPASQAAPSSPTQPPSSPAHP